MDRVVQTLPSAAPIRPCRVLDVTPSLDKSFSPTLVGTNQPSTLTLTITNTTDLLAKSDWSFTDTLPPGFDARRFYALAEDIGLTFRRSVAPLAIRRAA